MKPINKSYISVLFLLIFIQSTYANIDIEETPSGWVQCPSTIYGSCTDSDYLGDVIKMKYQAFSPPNNFIEFAVRKCDQSSFISSGTIYVKDGDICGDVVAQVDYTAGAIFVFIEIPLDYWIAGSKDFTITANSSSGEKFNAGTVNLFKECEDYQVSNTTMDQDTLFQGQQVVPISCIVENLGNLTSSNDVTYFISTDSIFDPSSDFDLGSEGFALPGGESITITSHIDIPPNYTPGSYYIVTYADDNNNEEECQEWNNGSSKFVVINPSPDLEITSLTSNVDQLCENGEIELTYTIENNGAVECPNGIDLGFYLSYDASYGPNDFIIGSDLTNQIPINASQTITVEFDDIDVPASDYYIIAVIDVNEELIEQYEDNNTFITNNEIDIIGTVQLNSPSDNTIIETLEPIMDWGSVNNANEYAVAVTTFNGTFAIGENTGMNTEYAVQPNELNPETTYKWKAAVLLEDGTSCNSDEWQFTTPCSDTYEPNDQASNPNTSAFANILGETSYSNSINSYLTSEIDVDYFEFNTSQSGEITIDLTNLPANYELELWLTGGVNYLDASVNTGTTSEQIIYDHTGGIESFYIKIYSIIDEFDCENDYQLSLSWQPSSTGGGLELGSSITTVPKPAIFDQQALFTTSVFNNSNQPWYGKLNLQLLNDDVSPIPIDVIWSDDVYISGNGIFDINHSSSSISTSYGNYNLRVVYSDDNGINWDSIGNGGFLHPQPFVIAPTSIQLSSAITHSPLILEHGQSADFDVNVENFGEELFFDSISLQLLDENMNNPIWLVKDKYSLTNGGDQNLHFSTDSIQSIPGTYYLEVVVYDGNEWHAAHEKNFTNPLSITINSPSDFLEITQPSSSSSFIGGGILTINWMAQGNVGNISIELRDAVNGLIAVIEDGIPASSSPNTSFIIPNCQTTGNYRIKMYETGTGNYVEYSELFQITKQEDCTCTITSPSLENGDPLELVNAADTLCQLSIIDDPINGDANPYVFATRAELAKMAFYTLFGDLDEKPSDAFPSPFLDLQNPNAWYFRYAKALSYIEYDNGITPFDRNLEFRFRANDPIPRAYAVKVLLETFNIYPDGLLLEPYDDVVDTTDSYAYIAKAYDIGLITNPNDSFRPYENTLRGEAFLMLYRLLQKIEDGTVVKPIPGFEDYFCPGNQKPSNFARNIGIDEGNFNHYSENSFSLPGISLTLDFTHHYNAYLTDLPDDFFPMRPLGHGWSHTYNSYIQDVTVYDEISGQAVQQLIQFYPSGQMIAWENTQQNYPYACTPITMGVYESLEYISPTIIEVTSKSQVVFQYEKMPFDGEDIFLLTKIKDRLDHEIGISYEDGELNEKRISSVELVLGNSYQSHRRLLFDYKPTTNYISKIWIELDVLTDPEIFFDVNEDGDLGLYTDRMGSNTNYKYINQIDSEVTEEEYEQKKHLLFEVELPKGNVINNSYQKRKLNSTTVNDKLKTDININYNYDSDEVGFSSDISTADLELGFTAFEKHVQFDEEDKGRINCVTLNSNITCFEYGENNNQFLPLKITDQETGFEMQMDYDDNGNLEQKEIYLVGSNNNQIPDYKYVINYNDYNDLTAYTDPSNNTVLFDYGMDDSKGLLYSLTDQEGNLTQFDYYLAPGNIWKYGGLKTITTPMGIITQYDYDLYGNLNSTLIPNDITTSTVFDELARVSSNSNANGNTYGYYYLPNDLIDSIVNPLNDVVSYGYDANYNIESITNERGYTTSLTYEFDTDLLQSVSFGGNTLSYEYYDEGRLKKVTKPDGTIITPSYVSSEYGIGQVLNDGYATHTYDSEHRIETVTKTNVGENHVITYHYDNLNRVTSYDFDVNGGTSYGYSVAYEYDNNSNLSKVKYPNLEGAETLDVSYIYYDNYWLKEVIDWEGKKVEFYYHADGGIDYIKRPNNTICKYQYSIQTRRISGKTDSIANGAVINKYIYILDDHGNIISETRTEPHAEISLKSMILSASYKENNFTDQVNGVTYQINNNGNLISDGENTYTWDNAFDVLQSINESINFKYDGLGNRREKIENGTKNRYIHDMLGMSNVIAEMDGSNIPTAYYIYAGNQLLYRKKPNENSYDDHYYHYNFQGSTVAMTNENGTITHSYGYSPYGEILDQVEEDSNLFTFNGEYGVIHEQNGFYNMRARYYDSGIGRFLSQDPIWSTNLFGFGNGNPVMMGDPSGEISSFIKALNSFFRGKRIGESLKKVENNEYQNSPVGRVKKAVDIVYYNTQLKIKTSTLAFYINHVGRSNSAFAIPFIGEEKRDELTPLDKSTFNKQYELKLGTGSSNRSLGEDLSNLFKLNVTRTSFAQYLYDNRQSFLKPLNFYPNPYLYYSF